MSSIAQNFTITIEPTTKSKWEWSLSWDEVFYQNTEKPMTVRYSTSSVERTFEKAASKASKEWAEQAAMEQYQRLVGEFKNAGRVEIDV